MAKDHMLSAASAAAAIGGAYKVGEFLHKAKRLRDVGPSNAVYVRLIARVRADLDEVRRLLTVREIHDALEANPEKAKWVYGAMRDVRGALENIAPHTERVASDIEDGRRVGMRHRLYWLVSEKEKLENREKELMVAHSSLNEVIGYLTALEPVEAATKHRSHETRREAEHNTHDTKVEIDIRRDAPERERVERDVWVERDGPRRVEERETYIEREQDYRGPRRVEERETYIEREQDYRGPRRVEERETYIEREQDYRGPRRVEEHWVERDRRGPRYEEREAWVDERGPRRYEERETYEHGPRRYEEHDRYEAQCDDRRYDERGLHIERDPRDPRHVEASYYERGPAHYEEKRYEERRCGPPRRHAEDYEDRVPERESWRQSSASRPQYGQHGEYAEYGAPQPIGAAQYGRRFTGDPGFGDNEVLNPQPVPPNRDYEREVSPKPTRYGRN